MKPTVIKIKDIPGVIFRSKEFNDEVHHFRCQRGSYSKKKFMIGKKEGKIIYGKCSGSYILIVLFAPFKESVKYDLLIRVGKIEGLLCKELQNDTEDEFVSYCKGLVFSLRKIDNALISKLIMDMISVMIKKPRY